MGKILYQHFTQLTHYSLPTLLSTVIKEYMYEQDPLKPNNMLQDHSRILNGILPRILHILIDLFLQDSNIIVLYVHSYMSMSLIKILFLL